MKSLNPISDPIIAFQRREKAVRSAGNKLPCACGESRIGALIPNSKPPVCAECQRKQKGKNTMDKHHVAGRANSSVTIEVPVNDHRAILSEAQYEWPKETLRNPRGCPLRAFAAWLRGFLDTVRRLLDEFLSKIVLGLEWLSEYLAEQMGPEWWLDTPLAQFSLRRKQNVGN